MKPGENFTLYCMRLDVIAKRAYPGDPRCYLQPLKKRLVQTLPEPVVRKIEAREELKFMLKQGRKINWREIMDIAENYDKHNKRLKLDFEGAMEKGICNQVNVTECDNVQLCSSNGISDSTGVRIDGQNDWRSSPAIPQCHYCGRMGHNASTCWFVSGACSLCGSLSHRYKMCPRFRLSAKFSPRCPVCQDQHLGKDCPNRNTYNR